MLPGVMEVFLRFGWPGNIRELSHTIERLVVLNTGGTIHADDLPPDMFVIRENGGGFFSERGLYGSRSPGEGGSVSIGSSEEENQPGIGPYGESGGPNSGLPGENTPRSSDFSADKQAADDFSSFPEGLTLEAAIDELKRKMVMRAYEKTGSSVKTARMLGVSQPTASRLIREYVKK